MSPIASLGFASLHVLKRPEGSVALTPNHTTILDAKFGVVRLRVRACNEVGGSLARQSCIKPFPSCVSYIKTIWGTPHQPIERRSTMNSYFDTMRRVEQERRERERRFQEQQRMMEEARRREEERRRMIDAGYLTTAPRYQGMLSPHPGL